MRDKPELFACGFAALDADGDFKVDPALAAVIEAWPAMPPHIRAAVAALVGVAPTAGESSP